jgi:hypothetical protein
VTEVEKGYDSRCLIQEYWNDLDIRELIHDIGYDDKVRELDERFAAMLTATHIKHWREERASDYDFWNYGYPKNAVGYFLDDIKYYILNSPLYAGALLLWPGFGDIPRAGCFRSRRGLFPSMNRGRRNLSVRWADGK